MNPETEILTGDNVLRKMALGLKNKGIKIVGYNFDRGPK
jgi:hypothetical protein